MAREAGESLSKSTIPALSWIWGTIRSGSRVVPLFGVMLKLDMEGMAAGIWRVALRFARGFLNFFSILAILQACYPFGQEVALEHAVEPGTARSSHGDREGESRSVTSWRWKADGASSELPDGMRACPLTHICRGSLGAFPDTVCSDAVFRKWGTCSWCWEHKFGSGCPLGAGMTPNVVSHQM